MRADTVAALLGDARNQLVEKGIETPAIDARLLLQAAAGLSHEEIIASPEAVVSASARKQFNSYIERRLKHEPVSRILATREFFGRSFKVTPDVLDPRPDTEALIVLALKTLRRGKFIDIGTGSGAIAITLCAENNELEGMVSDVSAAALEVAKRNAHAHGVEKRLQFHHASWLEGLNATFDLIISNPPYIRDGEKLEPAVQNYDPHLALFGGADGLASYRAISAGAASHLNSGGVVLVEVGMGQAPQVAEIFAKSGFELFGQAEDLGGRLRALAFKQR